MSFTESTMLALGTEAPAFELPDTVSGKTMTYSDIAEGKKATLVIFTCNHCPYALHVNPQIVGIAEDYQSRGLGIVAISSNDVEKYPEDGPDEMKAHAARVGYTFPYLYDESQEVARAYDAACTPDFYVFDAENKLYYRGRIDGSRPKNDVPPTGEDLRAAIDAALAGEPAPEKQYPSGGCNIKWK